VRAKPPPRPKRAAAPTTSDPIEIAMTAEASGRPPESVARALLQDQRRLIRLQIVGERAGLALKFLTGLVAVLALTALGAMAWQASRDDSLVVRVFSVPPPYAARGLSGEVIAGRFMDRLREVQQINNNSSLVLSRTLRNDGDAIRIEIPQTGVSLGEVQRLLNEWLGRRTVIEGALAEAPDGTLAMDVRVGAIDTVRVSGSPADLDRMLLTAAEESFAAIDPGQRAIYMAAVGRRDEALAAARALAVSRRPGAPDRAALLSIWGLQEPDTRLARRVLQQAIAIRPSRLAPWRNLALVEFREGREQAAFDAATQMLGLNMDGEQHRAFDPDAEASLRQDAGYMAALLQGDYARARAMSEPSDGADAVALSHDGDLMAERLAAAQAEAPLLPGDEERARALYAATRGDWAGMAAAVADYEAARARWFATPERAGLPPRSASAVLGARYAQERDRRILPLKAVALARTRQIEAARAVATALPLDCDACLRARAEVESAAGAYADADAWYARAAAHAPRLPQAEAAWGASLLHRGDPGRALARLSSAARKGPRCPDPLELWGEALLATGDAKAAAAKFERAARLAPRWGRLHLKWGEALAAQGKTGEARARWRAAAGMDLTPAERARVTALLAGARA
jgi:Tfp pilus assembly protein PilF